MRRARRDLGMNFGETKVGSILEMETDSFKELRSRKKAEIGVTNRAASI